MIVAALLGCGAPGPQPQHGPLRHEAYVWQQAWTEPVRQGIEAGAEVFGGFRIHALSAGAGGVRRHDVELRPLAAAGLPVVPVARVEVGAPVSGAEIGEQLAVIVERWREAGLEVSRVELDHDCPSSRLVDYAGFLRGVRGALQPQLALSITALPTWLDAPGAGLRAVLAGSDASVLQVHAIDPPREGLFEPRRARRWIDRWASVTPHPFQVAVPAYGVRLLEASDGALAIEAEALRLDRGVAGRELWAEPADVLALLDGLSVDRPPGLDGVVWFRLPTPADERAWTLSAIASVIGGRLPVASIGLELAPGPAPGLHDLWLVNRGDANGPAPETIWIEGRCAAADAAGGYDVVRRQPSWGLQRRARRTLAPSERLSVGWIRCDERPRIRMGEG